MLILLICHLTLSGEHNSIKVGMDHNEIIHSKGKAKTDFSKKFNFLLQEIMVNFNLVLPSLTYIILEIKNKSVMK